MLKIEIHGNGLELFTRAVRVLGDGTARRVYARSINETGRVAGTAAGRALAKQTGLPTKTTMKAVRRRVDLATPSTLSYVVHGSGGNISLKHFKPRETSKGVSAAPWKKRTLYRSTFMKAGFWPTRVEKPNWNGQVFKRVGYGFSFKTETVNGRTVRTLRGTAFQKQKSGLFIPVELVQGATAAAWDKSIVKLDERVLHHIDRVTGGLFK